MGTIKKPDKYQSHHIPGDGRTEWVLAESACREIIQSKIDCTDFRGGEDRTTIGKVFAKDVSYAFNPYARAGGRTIVGREERPRPLSFHRYVPGPDVSQIASSGAAGATSSR